MNKFPAHIRVDDEKNIEIIQTVEEHCRSTAKYAEQMLKSVGLGRSAYLAGLVHDTGKFTELFRDYLIHSIHGEKFSYGTVNHTFAGVGLLLNSHHQKKREFSDIACEILALAAGSHHGWFDCVDEQKKNGFEYRKNKRDIHMEEAVANFYQFCAEKQEIDQLFEEAVQELQPILEKICTLNGNADTYDVETAFYSGMLVRLLLSSVIEGDRRDTAEFMNAARFPKEKDDIQLKQMWRCCLERVERKLNMFPQETEIQRARSKISDCCKDFAKNPGGIFRLNVPTGGGKTLSALRYALAHGGKWGKQRIVFTSPLLSILDQNAQVIRDFVQDDSIILEHHSNLPQTEEELAKLGMREPLSQKEKETMDRKELLKENWDAPIIITTLIQLLNCFFSGKTTAIRRFHSLCNSIIVIDEVQTVPNNLLSLFTLAVNFLSKICGATVVLCSATQPCMEKTEHPLCEPIDNIVPYDPIIWRAFQRTEIQDVGSMSLEEIADFTLELLKNVNSMLIICNKKDEAEMLFYQLKDFDGDCYHLSAAMCIAHRKNVLEQIKTSLDKKDGTRTLCISTQLIEAGVDISFEQVIRLSAGMDSIIQAAGRCNRNGEAGLGKVSPVYLIQCKNESLSRLPDIQLGKDATLALLCEFKQNREQFKNSLESEEAITYYYRSLYNLMNGRHQDYKVKGKRYTLLSLLSLNESFANSDLPGCDEYYFHQAFRLAGALFQVFSEDTTDVLVPYREGKEIIENLNSKRAEYDLSYVQLQIKQAKPYTVSLYQYQLEQLKNEVQQLNGGVLALCGHYDENIGFSIQENKLEYLEV